MSIFVLSRILTSQWTFFHYWLSYGAVRLMSNKHQSRYGEERNTKFLVHRLEEPGSNRWNQTRRIEPDAHGKWFVIFVVFNSGYTFDVYLIQEWSEFHIILLPFSKKNKANKYTYVPFSKKHSNFAQIIPILRRTSTSSIKLTKYLRNSRMVLHHSRIAQPSRNSYFAQSHSRMVSILTLRRAYIVVSRNHSPKTPSGSRVYSHPRSIWIISVKFGQNVDSSLGRCPLKLLLATWGTTYDKHPTIPIAWSLYAFSSGELKAADIKTSKFTQHA